MPGTMIEINHHLLIVSSVDFRDIKAVFSSHCRLWLENNAQRREEMRMKGDSLTRGVRLIWTDCWCGFRLAAGKTKQKSTATSQFTLHFNTATMLIHNSFTQR